MFTNFTDKQISEFLNRINVSPPDEQQAKLGISMFGEDIVQKILAMPSEDFKSDDKRNETLKNIGFKK